MIAVMGEVYLHGVLPAGTTASLDGQAKAVVGRFSGAFDEIVKMFDGVFGNRNHTLETLPERGGRVN